MRPRLLTLLAASTLVLFVGCAPTVAPTPSNLEPTVRTETPSPSPSSDAAVVEPEAAFDLSCDDVGAAIETVLGEPTAPLQPVMSVVSTMNWIPGPAQYMFQRAGGIACSAGDESAHWEVTVVPGAQDILLGVSEKLGDTIADRGECSDGLCTFEMTVGDVHLSASFAGVSSTADVAPALDAALLALTTRASESLHEVAHPHSEIAGARCDRFITEAELSAMVGSDVALFTEFGGWGIPAQVYNVVNGSRICYFTEPGGDYEARVFLQITTLPAGAWAFERQTGQPIAVDGADAAKLSSGDFGRTHVDLRVGPDWIRLTTFDDGSGSALDPMPLVERVVRTVTVGHEAPQ